MERKRHCRLSWRPIRQSCGSHVAAKLMLTCIGHHHCCRETRGLGRAAPLPAADEELREVSETCHQLLHACRRLPWHHADPDTRHCKYPTNADRIRNVTIKLTFPFCLWFFVLLVQNSDSSTVGLLIASRVLLFRVLSMVYAVYGEKSCYISLNVKVGLSKCGPKLRWRMLP